MGTICQDICSVKKKPGTNTSTKPSNPRKSLGSEISEIDEKKAILKKTPDIITRDDLNQLITFQKTLTIQDDFFSREKDKNDFTYYKLKQYERQKLEELFKKNYEIFEKKYLHNFKLVDKDNNMIDSIINNENSRDLITKKIAKRIENISFDAKKYNIDYLTILLIGRKNVGKTTLINYILDSKDGENLQISEENTDFKTYKSNNVPYLKLIEFKGFEYNEGGSPDKIGEKAINLIDKLINRIGANNYNDFIHCIWYCISGTRFEDSEVEVFKQLKNSYPGEDTMPIIFVYTQTSNDEIADEMFETINQIQANQCIIKTVAEKIYLDEDDENNYIEERGKDELLKETLDKCTKALKGNMINLMIGNISKELGKNLEEENDNNDINISKEIIDEFINEYTLVLNDADFINYIIKIFVLKLQKFFDDEMKFSNKTKNLLINSNLVKDIKIFVEKILKSINNEINNNSEKMAKKFINEQAIEEKNFLINDIKNKRQLKDFIKTSKKFLKDNYYYKIQTYIIKYLIEKKLPQYLNNFTKKVDSITNDLLKIEDTKNENIKKHLEYCFLIKLYDFALNRGIMLEKPQFNFNENYKFLNDDKNNEDEKLIEIQSFSNIEDNNINDAKKTEPDKINNEEIQQGKEWFTFKNKTISDDNKLSQFLQEVKEQESELYKNTEDIPLKALNNHIINDLMNFFNSNKREFIKNKIDKNFGKNNFSFENNIIKNILTEEKYDLLYQKKINDELNILINDNNFTKLDYITILVIGKSGIGKSTLINHMLKFEGENLLETGVGKPVTKNTKSYINNELPFLNLIDTAGMELSKELNPENILKNVHDTIKNTAKLVENENNNYNKYIQCIWYCINDSDLQEVELNLIKELKKKYIPLIVVYTHSIDIKKIKRVKNKIKENFKDLPFIDVLAKPNKKKAAYGLNNLLNLTLDVCQKYEKGNIYKSIRRNKKKKQQLQKILQK